MANYSSPQNGTDFAAIRGFTKSWFRLHQEEYFFATKMKDQRSGSEDRNEDRHKNESQIGSDSRAFDCAL